MTTRTKTSNWFEVKLRYDKVHEDGCEKKVIESYVVEALSFGEAEKRLWNSWAAMCPVRFRL